MRITSSKVLTSLLKTMTTYSSRDVCAVSSYRSGRRSVIVSAGMPFLQRRFYPDPRRSLDPFEKILVRRRPGAGDPRERHQPSDHKQGAGILQQAEKKT